MFAATETWQAMKQLLPDAKKSNVFTIFKNRKWPTENPSVAKIINQYFVSVEKHSFSVSKHSDCFYFQRSSFEFHMRNVTVNIVLNALRSLKTNKDVRLDEAKCPPAEGWV